MARITEAEVALVALQIAADRTDGTATFHNLRNQVPDYLRLSPDDQKQSLTRRNEEVSNSGQRASAISARR